MKALTSELDAMIGCQEKEKLVSALKTIIEHSGEIGLKDSALAISLESALKFDDIDVLKLTAKCVAELAKTDSYRNALSLESIISSLLQLFSYDNGDLTIQIYRALGNLCYDNETSRKHIGKAGLEIALNQLKSSKCPEDAELQKAGCGFLLNLLMESDELQSAALDYKIFDVVLPILKQLDSFILYENCFTHVLLVLNMVADQLVDLWLPQDVCSAVVELLKCSKNLNISELCVEVLYNQLENGKLLLFIRLDIGTGSKRYITKIRKLEVTS